MAQIWNTQTTLTQNDLDRLLTDPRLNPNSAGALQSLLETYGAPLVGVFIFGMGDTPDVVIERHSFPAETGESSAQQLAYDLDAMVADIQAGSEQPFTYATHVWNYREDSLYMPRTKRTQLTFNPFAVSFVASGDFSFYVSFSSSSIPAGWWNNLD